VKSLVTEMPVKQFTPIKVEIVLESEKEAREFRGAMSDNGFFDIWEDLDKIMADRGIESEKGNCMTINPIAGPRK